MQYFIMPNHILFLNNTRIVPWGKYEYQKLPMGLSNSPDIFQEKMNEVFSGLEYVRAYIDDLLILTTDN